MAATVLLQRFGVHNLIVYVVLGTTLWLALHEGGVHPTLAGVAMGLLAPVTPRIAPEYVDAEELADLSSADAAHRTADLARSSVSTVEWLEHVLHPWTSYVIVPLFALANAGVVVSTDSLRTAFSSAIFWGIAAGLVLGKPLGVLIAAKVAVRSGRADRPDGTTTRQLLGAGNAAGLGRERRGGVAGVASALAAGCSEALVDVQQCTLLFGRQQRIVGDGLANTSRVGVGIEDAGALVQRLGADLQRLGDLLEDLRRRLAQPTLDLRQVRVAHPGGLGQTPHAHARDLSLRADEVAEISQ